MGCVWFAIDLSFLDVVFFLFFAIMRYLSLDESSVLSLLPYIYTPRWLFGVFGGSDIS